MILWILRKTFQTPLYFITRSYNELKFIGKCNFIFRHPAHWFLIPVYTQCLLNLSFLITLYKCWTWIKTTLSSSQQPARRGSEKDSYSKFSQIPAGQAFSKNVRVVTKKHFPLLSAYNIRATGNSRVMAWSNGDGLAQFKYKFWPGSRRKGRLVSSYRLSKY